MPEQQTEQQQPKKYFYYTQWWLDGETSELPEGLYHTTCVSQQRPAEFLSGIVDKEFIKHYLFKQFKTEEEMRAYWNKAETEQDRPTFEFELHDYAPGYDTKVKVRIAKAQNQGFLEIRPEGYGEMTAIDGCGSPVLMEVYQGRLRLMYSPDINSEDVEVVDLEGAREDKRRPDQEA